MNENNIKKLENDIINTNNNTSKDIDYIKESINNIKIIQNKDINNLESKFTSQLDSMRKVIDIRNSEISANINQNNDIYLGIILL